LIFKVPANIPRGVGVGNITLTPIFATFCALSLDRRIGREF
jgi:hypothetical protein